MNNEPEITGFWDCVGQIVGRFTIDFARGSGLVTGVLVVLWAFGVRWWK